MHKPLKITLIILSCLVAFFLIILLLVGPIARNYVNHNGEKILGRKVQIERLRANLLTGRVRVNSLTVFEDDKTTEFLKFDTLDISVCLRKMLAHHIYVRHFTLADLNVQVLQNGKEFNFSSIIDHFKTDEPQPEEEKEGKPWKMSFYNIRLAHWKIFYADLQKQSEWKLKDVNIEVPGVSFGGESNTDAGITLAMADGGSLTTQLRYNVESNDFDAHIDLQDFAISNAKAYLLDLMNLDKMDGRLAAKIHAKGNLSQIMDMNINGNINLSNLAMTDDHKDQVLDCRNLAVKVKDIVLSENRFDIASVAIDGLSSNFGRYKNGSNFSHLFAKPAAEHPAAESATADTTQAAPAESKPIQLSIGDLAIKNSSFRYHDHTLPDSFEYRLSDISAHSSNLSLDGTNALQFSASLPHGGQAVIDWKGTLRNIKEYQDLMLTIKNVSLTDLSPYTVAYLGQPFTKGTFSFTSRNTIHHSQLDGQNHIDIYKPEVGKRRKDVDSTLNIPLKAALYVLKDKNDKVQIEVPVKGNIDSPEFNYMKIVWKTLGNLFVKVATSPVRGIADALGLSSSNFDFLDFDPTQSDFTSEQYYVMEQLARVANYDTNILIIMEQQFASSCTEETVLQAENRNQSVRAHFLKLGIPASQLQVSTSENRGKKTGYIIHSEIREGAIVDFTNSKQ